MARVSKIISDAIGLPHYDPSAKGKVVRGTDGKEYHYDVYGYLNYGVGSRDSTTVEGAFTEAVFIPTVNQTLQGIGDYFIGGGLKEDLITGVDDALNILDPVSDATEIFAGAIEDVGDIAGIVPIVGDLAEDSTDVLNVIAEGTSKAIDLARSISNAERHNFEATKALNEQDHEHLLKEGFPKPDEPVEILNDFISDLFK